MNEEKKVDFFTALKEWKSQSAQQKKKQPVTDKITNNKGNHLNNGENLLREDFLEEWKSSLELKKDDN